MRGSEANKRRPAVIVSNDRANVIAAQLGRGVVTVAPVTSNIDRIFPFQALRPAGTTELPQDSKAQAEQIRAISVERLGAILGRAPTDVMVKLDDALRLHLQL